MSSRCRRTENYNLTFRATGRNWKNSSVTDTTSTISLYDASLFGQSSSSGSMAVYQRSHGYDGGSLTGTTDTFTGEDFRIRNTNDVTGFNGKAWFTNFTSSQDHLGTYDLQVASNFDAKGLQAIDFLINGTGITDNDIVTYFHIDFN